MMPYMNEIPSTVQLEEPRCPICHTQSYKTIVTSHDRLTDLPGEYTVVACLICGLQRTSPRPTLQTMSYYYPDAYSPFSAESREPSLLGNIAASIFQFN